MTEDEALRLAEALVFASAGPVGARALSQLLPEEMDADAVLAALAVIAAILAYMDFARGGDVRWTIGGTLIFLSWPYAYFVMAPVNILLFSAPPGAPAQTIHELMREWGLLEWGQTAIGLLACCVFAWSLTS